MALGDVGNQSKDYGTTYYTRFNFRTKDGKLKLSPSFKNGLMNLTISQNKGEYQYDSIAYISLSPTKAAILASELEQFLADYSQGNIKNGIAYGVDTGFKDVRPFICGTFINNEPVIVIGRVTPQGTFEQRTDYPLNTNYHYGIKWNNLDNMECDKTYYNDTEIGQLISLLKEFSKQAFGAGAAATCEMLRLDPKVLSETVNAAASKLGVETRGSYGGRTANSTGNSFFNKDKADAARPKSNKTSLDALEESIGE